MQEQRSVNPIEEEDMKSYEDQSKIRRINQGSMEDIQYEIQETTKKIEHEKINSRICQERYEKQLKHYSELQGKPVPLSKEQKEKERQKSKEKMQAHKITDLPTKKTTKDKEILESNEKTLKAMVKYTTELENLTNNINGYALSNQELKDKIANLRKQKHIAIEQRDIVADTNKDKERQIEELRRVNEIGGEKIQTKRKDLARSIDTGTRQQKAFQKSRDELEDDYHKIISEYIKREREQKKEQAKKRHLLAMVADSKAAFKGANALELEKQMKMLANEEISDRAPILEILVSKWKSINKIKKHMIDKYAINAEKITRIFDKLMRFYELDRIDDLPLVFKKTINQMSNVELYLGKLENENAELNRQVQLYEEKIDYMTNEKDSTAIKKTSFAEEKKSKIEELTKKIEEVDEEINKQRNLFVRIQPQTDEYLNKLNQTYLVDYVASKLQIDPTVKYTESNVSKYISNVEDYYKLIQMFDDSVHENYQDNDTKELDRLRVEIKNKLDNYEKDKLMNNDFFVTMKNDAKNGLNYDEIIKKSSDFVLQNFNTPLAQDSKLKKKK